MFESNRPRPGEFKAKLILYDDVNPENIIKRLSEDGIILEWTFAHPCGGVQPTRIKPVLSITQSCNRKGCGCGYQPRPTNFLKEPKPPKSL